MDKLETLLACLPPSDFKNIFTAEIEQLRQRVHELTAERDELKQQRDELVAALERIATAAEATWCNVDWVAAHAKLAIASVKEK